MTDRCISPLRRRMIEDMTVRNFAAKTQHDYVQRVKSFAALLGRSPDTAKVVRRASPSGVVASKGITGGSPSVRLRMTSG
jgi:hypothetical protein